MEKNLVTLFDVGHEGGAPYVVSELLEGATLRERLAQGPLPPARAAAWMAEAARGRVWTMTSERLADPPPDVTVVSMLHSLPPHHGIATGTVTARILPFRESAFPASAGFESSTE